MVVFSARWSTMPVSCRPCFVADKSLRAVTEQSHLKSDMDRDLKKSGSGLEGGTQSGNGDSPSVRICVTEFK